MHVENVQGSHFLRIKKTTSNDAGGGGGGMGRGGALGKREGYLTSLRTTADVQSFLYIWLFHIWRVALLTIPRQPNSRFGKNRFCRQSAPCKSSGRTDYTNLRHFPVRIFSVETNIWIWHGPKMPQMRHLPFGIFTFGGRHLLNALRKLKIVI